ncbi:MAG: hypothetical protein H8D56_05585 [Planctomycetes bacterium]|nr:hypothetical protein [Planctomycetota bacterium]MBL7146398.1 hypothetical protein [Phycisphaerae bacterium]
MKRPENDKWLDEALSETIGSEKPRTDFEQWKQKHPQAVEMLTSRAKSKGSTIKRPHTIRIKIMKSPITKLAAAAVIIVALGLLINFWGSSVAYALDQTIEANHSVRYLHIKEITVGHEDEPKEFWLESYEDGQVKKVRIHMPSRDAPEDGAKVVVWKENTAQVWMKKKNVLLTVMDKAVADQMLKLVEAFDPRLAVERLYKQEAEGKVKIEIEEPSDKSKPIVVTATGPNRRDVLFVDQATKLVTAIKFYQFKDGEYQYQSVLELNGYNQPIDAKVFTLDDVPADVIRLDQTTQEVGLEQGNLTDEEVAAEVVRKFFEALIAKNYAGAGQFLEGAPADFIQKTFGHLKFLRIISVGPVGPHPVPETKGLVVPCTVEIEHDGETAEWKLERIGVREVYNQPGRWTIFGGI